MTIPFGRVLKLGMRGNDCHGVRRALARAGRGDLGNLTAAFNADAVKNLRLFQRESGLGVDGIYGPKTHTKLTPFFDDYAYLLYTGKPPRPPVAMLRLPAVFVPTHPTAGLPGYDAIDVFGKAGTQVITPSAGTVRRLSGHDPAQGGVPGGAYGWSIYLATDLGEFYMTHFGSRTVREGQKVGRGEVLGTVCDATVAHMATSLSHIHEGLRLAL